MIDREKFGTDFENLSQLDRARLIESALIEANIAYGPEGDPRLWKISPRYFVIRGGIYEQIRRQAEVIPKIIAGVSRVSAPGWDPERTTYFRFDTTIDRQGKVVATEFQNEVPVEDATVDTNRRIYEQFVSMPRGCRNPFFGSIDGITRAIKLNQQEDNVNVAVVLPKDRKFYLRDYRKGSEMMTEQGLNAWVEEGELKLRGDGLYSENGRIDVVHRAFTRSDLGSNGKLDNSKTISEAIDRGLVDIFPQFSPALEDKGVMAALFMPEYKEKIINMLGGKDNYLQAREVFPFTWICKADTPPSMNGQVKGWGKDMMDESTRKEGYIIKPRRSFGSSGVIVSSELTLPKWREAVFQAITNRDSNFILQRLVEPKRYWAQVLDGNRIVRTEKNLGVRLSVTCIAQGEEAQIVEVDACLGRGHRIHGTRESVLMPVVVKE